MMTTTEAIDYILNNTTEGVVEKVQETDYTRWYGFQDTFDLKKELNGFFYTVTERAVRVQTHRYTFRVKRVDGNHWDVWGAAKIAKYLTKEEVVEYIRKTA